MAAVPPLVNLQPSKRWLAGAASRSPPPIFISPLLPSATKSRGSNHNWACDCSSGARMACV